MDQTSPPWRVFDAPSTGHSGPNERAADAPTAAGISIQPVALLGLAGAFVLGIAAVVLAVGSMGGDRRVDGPAAGAELNGDPDAVGAVLVVEVAGAVVTPGVYRLPPGSRVGDAVEAAGGYGPRIDVARLAELNLAATLTDGARVRVPSRDDPVPVAGGGDGGDAGQAGGASALVDLNKASQSELEALPGIGPVTATKIMAARDEAPFRTIDELRERGLVGEKTFESIKALITI